MMKMQVMMMMKITRTVDPDRDGIPAWLPDFQPNAGLKVEMGGDTPLDYFQLFFTDELLDISANKCRYI